MPEQALINAWGNALIILSMLTLNFTGHWQLAIVIGLTWLTTHYIIEDH